MNIGPLSLFARTNAKRSFNIASWHSRHSLTWSWILSIAFDGTWRKDTGALRMGFHPFRTNAGLQWVLAAPFVVLHWHRQREMWYRDMFHRARGREEVLEKTVSKLRRELSLARMTAALPPEGGMQ